METDSDADGAPDALENSLGRNPYGALEDGLDADGDGQSDRYEMIVGTSPDDSGDYFFLSINLGGNLDPELTFSAKPGPKHELVE